MKLANFERISKKIYHIFSTASTNGCSQYAINTLGTLQYVLIALIARYMTITSFGAVTVGMTVAFLNLSKTFCMPVSQIAQQISMT